MPANADQFNSPGRFPAGAMVHVNEKGGRFGGTEEYIDLLSVSLQPRRSVMICGLLSAVPPRVDVVRVLPGLADRDGVPGTADELADQLAGFDAGVVMLHNVFDPTIPPAVVARMSGIAPVLWFVHDFYPLCMSELRWRRDVQVCPVQLGAQCLAQIDAGRCVLRYPDRSYDAKALADRAALSAALGTVDGVLVVSEFMRELVLQLHPGLTGRVHTLTRPVRRPAPDVAPRSQSRRTGAARFRVAFAGRITPEKGLDVLIDAVGLLPSVMPGRLVFELAIAGVVEDESYWAQCQHRMRTTTAERVGFHFVGEVDYPQVDALFAQSDVVAVPSQWPEPLGAVALEAMAAGVPVLVSDVGGMAELVTDRQTGRLVAAGNPVVWAEVLAELAADPATALALGHAGKTVAAQHSIERHLAELGAIVADLR